jgi:signal transduction histidine kinase
LKKLQRELREKENLALVGEVVSSIAHSFSNPLNIISGNADYLLLDKKEGEEGYEEMKIILEESARITKSIRHLLNFSRPLKMEKEKGSINNLITEVISNSKYLTGEKKIIFKKSLDTSIPDILLGKTEIQEVLSNLITNAIQAIKDEGEIRVKTWSSGSSVCIEIQDKGPGIPKENLDKIFLPFYSSKSFGKGTGLGLSIAKKIITEHGGEIRVKSNTGKGTAFTISLPV